MRLISVFCRWHTWRHWNQLPSNTAVLTPSIANILIVIYYTYFLYCKPRYLNRLYRMYFITSLFQISMNAMSHTLYRLAHHNLRPELSRWRKVPRMPLSHVTWFRGKDSRMLCTDLFPNSSANRELPTHRRFFSSRNIVILRFWLFLQLLKRLFAFLLSKQRLVVCFDLMLYK
jgi:hypothetical protein